MFLLGENHPLNLSGKKEMRNATILIAADTVDKSKSSKGNTCSGDNAYTSDFGEDRL